MQTERVCFHDFPIWPLTVLSLPLRNLSLACFAILALSLACVDLPNFQIYHVITYSRSSLLTRYCH